MGRSQGSNLLYLQSLLPQAHFTGIDFSPAKVDFARQFFPQADYRCADAQSLPFADASFDLVFCRDLLHHVDFNRKGVMAEMVRVVRPGGAVAVLESRGKTPLNLIFQMLFPAERGMRHSDPQSLIRLGTAFGHTCLDFLECSFLIRALGFVLGWPEKWGVSQYLANLVYTLGDAWERLLASLLSLRQWTYMLMTVEPDKVRHDDL